MDKNYKELYTKLWNYCEKKGIHIPISVIPYSEEERAARDAWPQPDFDPHLYWTSRDKEAYSKEEFCLLDDPL